MEAGATEAGLAHSTASDVAFHMTDWLDDLSKFITFLEAPDRQSAAQVNELLLAFLVHVPNHLAAAAKLYADSPVTDVFGVGSLAPST